jgi:transposase InsO family protein
LKRAQIKIRIDVFSRYVPGWLLAAGESAALLLADLGVAKTHSRPRVSNENPYSESQFKTMKYRPDFPDFFGSLEDARAWVRAFFDWYNHVHYHSSLGLLTPTSVNNGQAAALLEKRQYPNTVFSDGRLRLAVSGDQQTLQKKGFTSQHA